MTEKKESPNIFDELMEIFTLTELDGKIPPNILEVIATDVIVGQTLLATFGKLLTLLEHKHVLDSQEIEGIWSEAMDKKVLEQEESALESQERMGELQERILEQRKKTSKDH